MCARCRFQRGSEVCEKLARSLEHLTCSEERELFDFGRRSGDAAPLMLLLDRQANRVQQQCHCHFFQADIIMLMTLGIEEPLIDCNPTVRVCAMSVNLASAAQYIEQQQPDQLDMYRAHWHPSSGLLFDRVCCSYADETIQSPHCYYNGPTRQCWLSFSAWIATVLT
jgi:hypothetical protein